jgi:hypothetical protein
MRSRLLAGAANVAHLAGLGRGLAPVRSATSGDSEPEDLPTRENAPQPDPTCRAGRDSEDPDGDEDENEDGEDREDEDDDDEDTRQARARERARCQAILTSPHASRAVTFAAYLAFETTTPRKAALTMLERLPNGASLDARMGGVSRPNLGNGARPEQSDRHAVAASWDGAFTKARSGSRTQAPGWDQAMAAARR